MYVCIHHRACNSFGSSQPLHFWPACCCRYACQPECTVCWCQKSHTGDNEIYYLTGSASSLVLGYSYPVGTEINCLFYDELLVGTGTGLYAQADPSPQTASVSDLEKSLFTAYPNPAKSGNQLTISYTFDITNPTFRITNLQGKLIKEYQKNEVIHQAKTSKITVPQISKGVYLLSIYNKKRKLTTKKIVID